MKIGPFSITSAILDHGIKIGLFALRGVMEGSPAALVRGFGVRAMMQERLDGRRRASMNGNHQGGESMFIGIVDACA